MPARDVVLALLVVFIWALNIIVIKFGVAEMPPLMLVTLRFALVAVLLVPFYPVARHHLPFLLLLSVTFGTLHFALLFVGLEQAEAGTGAILVQMGTPFATLLAVAVLKESLGTKRLFGLLLSFAGVVVLAGGPTLPAALPTAMLLTGALAWATSQLLIKRGPDLSPMALAGWVALLATPQVALGSWWLEQDQWQALTSASWLAWGTVFYTAVMSSIVAYGIWYGLLRRHPVSSVVPMMLLVPVLAVILGVLLMNDSLGPHKLIGGGLVVAGIGLIVIQRKASRTQSDPLPDDDA